MSLEINKGYLKEQQYKGSNYLEARIAIHKYNTNKESLYGWIWKHLEIRKPVDILEIGCGTGSFWAENYSHLPAGSTLLMTDFSEGMIDKAKKNMVGHDIEFNVADIEKLAFQDESYDLVMAHHVIYHAENKDKALSELARVTKANGIVTITTNSEKHMLNVYEIGLSLDPNFPRERIIDSFTEEIADQMLGLYFPKVKKFVSEDSLQVNDMRVMIDYVRSAVEPRNIPVSEDFYERYGEIVSKEISEKGFFRIPKRSPLYICEK